MAKRKKPQQARSQATVDAIVEATGHVFEKGGFKRTTTTAVADRAGVSVGSLYQYFPDKKSLIAAFFERRLAHDVALMQAVLQEAAGGTPQDLLGAAARAIVRVYREDRELYMSVVEILPLMEQTEEVRTGIARGVALGATYLRTQPTLLGDRDPELLSLAMFHAMRGAMNAIVAHAPEKLDDPHLEAIIVGAAMGMLGLERESLPPARGSGGG
ncbi:MAG: TetR/AcrR family transcriptional regulator [Myxococcales bacterium]|nr:TetR/AcrR family transcriptional regulator [Myxococcales bacterium]